MIGLMIFVIVGWDLLLQQYRQALAASMLFYAITNLAEGHSSLKVILLSLISCTFHNSVIFIVIPFLLFSKMGSSIMYIKRSAFLILFLVFIFSLFIDLGWIAQKIATIFNLSATQKYSLSYHFGLSKITQSIILLYFFIYMLLSILRDDRSDKVSLTFRFISYIGLAYIALFYKYHLFTNRFSNYFIIITLIYSLDLLFYNWSNKHVNCRLAYQFFFCLIIFFSIYKVLPQVLILPNSHLYNETPTVLSTLFSTKSEIKQIQQEQMDKAAFFWEEELSDMYSNTTKSFNFSNN